MKPTFVSLPVVELGPVWFNVALIENIDPNDNVASRCYVIHVGQSWHIEASDTEVLKAIAGA